MERGRRLGERHTEL